MRSPLVAALLGAALVVVVLATIPFAGTMRTANAAARGPQPARVAYSAETGAVSFIGTVAGAPIARPSGLEESAAPTIVARAFLDRYGAAFGLRDQAGELRVTSVEPAPAGREVVRFQQVYEGVPVLGGELIVNLDATGNMLSLGGEALPGIDIVIAPQVSPLSAREAARTAVAVARGIEPAALRVSEPALWIYDARIMGGPGLDTPTLVWRTDVTGAQGEPIDELVLVDARLGDVALHFDQVLRAKSRQVCDAGNVYTQMPCTAPVRMEGGPPSPVVDVNNAYDYAGDTYDFYFGVLGRDGVDGAGLILKATTRWCAPALWFQPCPWPNGAWVSDVFDQMVYGEGYAHADDVVGHELTHGVTHYSSDLFGYYQSGAINESLSDVFGELIDQTNGKGTDTPVTRWQAGEDAPGGALRDMEDPTLFGDPDRMTSSYYRTGDSDSGGIHHNNGVNNKAAFLITDGGMFNGRIVNGLGFSKAARIYYEANTHLLSRASSYADLANALQQACTNLVGTAGITSADCVEVSDAVLAVEMAVPRTDPPNPAETPGRPGNVVATAGTSSANLGWTAPASDGGSPITGHVVTPYAGGVAQSMRSVGAGTSATITGLTAGTTYTFTVRASNAEGVGPASTQSNAVTLKANQTISFGFLPSRTYLDVDFAVSATASSGLPVSFAASGSCTVGGTNVHLTGAGTCTLTASQGGSAAYNAAPSVSQSFSIAKASQTISFGSALPGRTYGDADFTVGATTSSGLPVSFTASGACKVTGTSVHLTGSGTCTLTASQSGDVNHNPAPSVSRTFAIAQPRRPAQKIVCRVPKVVGKALASAKTTIKKNHCRTGTVKYAYSKKIKKGKVASQSRTAGRVLAANTKINLVVSRGVQLKKR